MSPLEPLAPDQRAVVALVLQQGRSYDEIAALLGIPVDAVRARAQEGLAALLAFDPNQGSNVNEAVVHKAAEALRLGGVAPAARDDAKGRFTAGDAVGYAGGELVAWGDPAETLAATLAQIAQGAELLTCIAGEQPPLDRAGVEARAPEGVEVEYHEGGQPAWWWLLCAE